MSKIIAATCESGVVKVGSLPIEGATILSAGVAASSGVLLMDDYDQTYVAKTSDDLNTTLAKIVDALQGATDSLTKISTVLTSIGAGMTGPTTAPPPTLATDVADLVTKIATIATARTALNTLKGNLK